MDRCPSSRSAADPTGDHILVPWRCSGCGMELPVDPRFPAGSRCRTCREAIEHKRTSDSTARQQ